MNSNNNMENTILITGAAGFIGSAYIWHLNTKNPLSYLANFKENIIVCDKFGKGEKWLNLRQLKYKDFIFPEKLTGQIEDYLTGKPTINNLLENIGGVLHLGACSSTTEPDMDFLYQNNIEFSKLLFKFCAKKKIPFLYASSAATYGDGHLGYYPSTNEHFIPLNKYGYSKQFFDLWVQRELKDQDGENIPRFTVALKFFNVFGPNEYHKGKMASVIFHAFHQIQEKGKIKLFKSYRDDIADGNQKRDFIYVKDACQQISNIWQMLEEVSLNPEIFPTNPINPKKLEIYNIGMGKAHSFNELAKGVFQALGKKEDIEYIDMPIEIRDKYQYFTKTENVDSGSTENMDFSAAIADYVNKHLNTPSPHLNSF